MDQLTIQSYDTAAAALCADYEAADPAALHAWLRRQVPPGAQVLDLGCGSGRDAAFMMRLGVTVMAVDASAAMLEQARLAHPELSACLHQAALPLPPEHPLLTRRFTVITCLAMLMHVPDEALFDLVFQIKQMLTADGLLLLSVSTGRQCLSDNRDAAGRLYLERPPGELRLLCERLGFRLLEHNQTPDTLGRPLTWHQLAFRLSAQTGQNPVDRIETIISRDKKDATYKLALLRALCDIAQTEYRQAEWRLDDTVSVPLGLLAEKWLFYYWPLIEPDMSSADGLVVIPQKRGLEINKPIAFRAAVLKLITHCSRGGGGLDTFFYDFRHGRLDQATAVLADTAVNAISNTIVVDPVKFAGGALDDQERFFWKSGPVQRSGHCSSSRTAIESLGKIHLRGEIWRELSLLGHWIGEALVMRWAELTHEISRQRVAVARVIELLLTRPQDSREQIRLRQFYRNTAGLRCVWTDHPLASGFEVDHLIPFTLWHNNDLWNLLSASRAANSQKRDKLVARPTLLDRRHTIIGYWELIRQQYGEQFDYELNRALTGGERLGGNWQNQAFSAMTAAVENLALQRGIARWEPECSSAASAATVIPAARVADSATAETAKIPMLADSAEILAFADIADDRRAEFLPLIGDIAAGTASNGFLTDRLENAAELDWVQVPRRLRGQNRFVVRVSGDSMTPELRPGALAVFEYHRRPRQQDQIVIAAIADFGLTADAAVAGTIKRLHETATAWEFIPANPKYPGFSIPKTETEYPILGVLVGGLNI